MTRSCPSTEPRQRKKKPKDALPLQEGYKVRLSTSDSDPEWDSFVAATPGGGHTQSTLWAQVKASVGWRAVRVIVTQGKRMVGGAQILVRRLPVGGSAAYVQRGPILARDDTDLAGLLASELRSFADEAGVQYFAVRPPLENHDLARRLERSGFQASLIEVDPEPAATVVVDLTADTDVILARMEAKTRYNIRLSMRKGVVVREGTGDDLPTFYRLLLSTSERQAFSTNTFDYYSEVWRTLSPPGHVKLFLAEVDGEAVSSLLAIPFGDTVTYWRGAWSGRLGNVHPNEALQWAAITWAKSHGYRRYDFEGIDKNVAEAIARGEQGPKSRIHPLTSYKLGFGGHVALYPGLYNYMPNPLVRWAYGTIFARFAQEPVMTRVVNSARGMES